MNLYALHLCLMDHEFLFLVWVLNYYYYYYYYYYYVFCIHFIGCLMRMNHVHIVMEFLAQSTFVIR